MSVVMPVYNAEPYLSEAVESILNQTLADFDFIIVNDGSTDASRAILESYGDSRILLLDNQENRGVTYSLNKGLAAAKGEYVARMDADDISVPSRLEKQVAFLDEHPDVGILGCSCFNIDPEGRRVGSSTMPKTDLEVRWVSLLGNPFIHSTVMIRRDILVSKRLKYDETLETTQDYELWTRILQHTLGGNLRDPLVWYRRGDNLTHRHRKSQLNNHDRIALRTIREQLPRFAVNLEVISDLRRLFMEKADARRTVVGKRVLLAHLYLDMFEHFMGCNPSPRDRSSLKKKVAAKVASIILNRPLEDGCLAGLKRIALLEPTVVLSVLPNLIRK